MARDIMARKKEIEDAQAKAYEIQSKYQEAIRRSEANRIQILKALQNDYGLDEILLKALETIYLMTGDEAFYRQAEERLRQYR